jgi:Lon protease-like protein
MVVPSPPVSLPLFALGMVALPGELVPLHIFEPRYLAMVEHCLTCESEFGIVWATEEECKSVGCACEIDRVLERKQDGKLNILVRGTRSFRLIERVDEPPYPTGLVEFLHDDPDEEDPETADAARAVYAELLEAATERVLDVGELSALSAHAMAATVDFGSDAKQELLELRSERARMALLRGLLRAAIKRLELIDYAQERARSNGKVHFR